MAREKTQAERSPVEKMNAVIDLIAQTNRMLDKATIQADKLQVAQFERLKTQFVGQLVELVGANRLPIEIARKGTARKAA